MIGKFSITCRKHPTYMAKRHPMSVCWKCWRIWYLRQDVVNYAEAAEFDKNKKGDKR